MIALLMNGKFQY